MFFLDVVTNCDEFSAHSSAVSCNVVWISYLLFCAPPRIGVVQKVNMQIFINLQLTAKPTEKVSVYDAFLEALFLGISDLVAYVPFGGHAD